jgi:endonuclease/exonuclease/phosphatase family metal-dependent hydrolase
MEVGYTARVRFLLYNIRYGTGGKKRLPWTGYLKRTSANLSRISRFLAAENADIVGLIEVDGGSYRSERTNQAETIARRLGHYHTYTSKYAHRSLARRVPLVNRQGNAFLTRDTVRNAEFHFFRKGVKRLVIELETDRMVVFLVHLAVTFRARHQQLGDLYEIVNGTRKPHIVAGDFNAVWGDREIGLFLAATRLKSANESGLATFPSWEARRQLDFILYSEGIRPAGFRVPPVVLSDHLPLIFDFDLGGPSR